MFPGTVLRCCINGLLNRFTMRRSFFLVWCHNGAYLGPSSTFLCPFETHLWISASQISTLFCRECFVKAMELIGLLLAFFKGFFQQDI
jgi:hypothetical protein